MLARSLLTLLLLAPTAAAQDVAPAPDERPHNLILMIADGLGPAAVALGREVQGRPLALDSLLRGAVRTPSASHPITDSAAGAVAYASGIKTKNRTIGVDTLGRPVGTILEAAEERGMATGVVSTTRVTDATPAAFSAHQVSRYAENDIAVQQRSQPSRRSRG
jgi:alkaline phosphatase